MGYPTLFSLGYIYILKISLIQALSKHDFTPRGLVIFADDNISHTCVYCVSKSLVNILLRMKCCDPVPIALISIGGEVA